MYEKETKEAKYSVYSWECGQQKNKLEPRMWNGKEEKQNDEDWIKAAKWKRTEMNEIIRVVIRSV